ncbi:UNKNOWN [Stylonychia lemnae]|uniref:Uncharacterized protein n=1 Tax=Stylonychia lemnae TaxID=5949 RepID=A0A077ZSJ4_STYLE|nr:UNKNOWN [Stylonychia lemnae]|eukprot:CDW72848.1 UNKNOWN [Stylonychia lemnae]
MRITLNYPEETSSTLDSMSQLATSTLENQITLIVDQLPGKSAKSKAIKKLRDSKQFITKTSFGLPLSERKLLLISSQKYLTLNSDDNGVGCELNTDFRRSYLKGSRAEFEVKSLLKKCSALQKRISPIDSDLGDSKISFDEQLQKKNITNPTNVTIITQPYSFYKTNDISSKEFNPVINRIQTFMAKKEKRNGGKSGINTQSDRQNISFLSIRNLWQNPSAASSMLQRARSENVNSQGAHSNGNQISQENVSSEIHGIQDSGISAPRTTSSESYLLDVSRNPTTQSETNMSSQIQRSLQNQQNIVPQSNHTTTLSFPERNQHQPAFDIPVGQDANLPSLSLSTHDYGVRV